MAKWCMFAVFNTWKMVSSVQFCRKQGKLSIHSWKTAPVVWKARRDLSAEPEMAFTPCEKPLWPHLVSTSGAVLKAPTRATLLLCPGGMGLSNRERMDPRGWNRAGSKTQEKHYISVKCWLPKQPSGSFQRDDDGKKNSSIPSLRNPQLAHPACPNRSYILITCSRQTDILPTQKLQFHLNLFIFARSDLKRVRKGRWAVAEGMGIVYLMFSGCNMLQKTLSQYFLGKTEIVQSTAPIAASLK